MWMNFVGVGMGWGCSHWA